MKIDKANEPVFSNHHNWHDFGAQTRLPQMQTGAARAVGPEVKDRYLQTLSCRYPACKKKAYLISGNHYKACQGRYLKAGMGRMIKI